MQLSTQPTAHTITLASFEPWSSRALPCWRYGTAAPAVHGWVLDEAWCRAACQARSWRLTPHPAGPCGRAPPGPGHSWRWSGSGPSGTPWTGSTRAWGRCPCMACLIRWKRYSQAKEDKAPCSAVVCSKACCLEQERGCCSQSGQHPCSSCSGDEPAAWSNSKSRLWGCMKLHRAIIIAISMTVVTPQLPWVAVCRVCRLPADLTMAIALAAPLNASDLRQSCATASMTNSCLGAQGQSAHLKCCWVSFQDWMSRSRRLKAVAW